MNSFASFKCDLPNYNKKCKTGNKTLNKEQKKKREENRVVLGDGFLVDLEDVDGHAAGG